MSSRTKWYAPDLSIKNEPLVKSLLEYRLHKDRTPLLPSDKSANLLSSITDDGKQMPILDLDFAHEVKKSSTDGHTHLYLNTPISKFRWVVLMLALRYAKVIETGFLVWSLRRGGNFVRIKPTVKGESDQKSEYGWFKKVK